ncbi:esterase FE4 [Papilio machaon]|uniref:esterase FE4 n=1 Tax=Papilio machaon TaxID=76193 RepID=UPI001E66489B|nr:esterase FE4 [Papilio machaon]XP_014362172.2 esterase FE4 [Papilio machaon]
MSAPEVTITDGKLRGKICQSLNGVKFYTFKGIPYAKPPVGDLRFSIPEPPEPWEGVKDTTKNCNICAQYDRATGTVIGDEDCLYLNVYTPRLPHEGPQLPVMVFIHGGGFLFGNGTDDTLHGPDYLIEKEVVIVSLNYRLGILGFLSLGQKGASGNMGLKDQLLALKWVQQNIAQFGGDPKNVTIFGVSAGGASVEYLLLSPTTKGLFHKAIAQSGSSLLHWAQNNEIEKLAYKIPLIKKKFPGNNDELLKILKEMPVKELIQASMIALAMGTHRGGITFGFVPTVEKSGDWEQFINKSTYDMLSNGEFTKVPFMSGFCTREGLLMIPFNPQKIENISSTKSFVSELPFNFDITEKDELDKKLKLVYLEGEKTHKDDDYYAIDFLTDVDFLGGVYVATSLIAKKNSPVYFYEFSYDGNLNYFKKTRNIDRGGACHGDDGGYLIKCDIFKEAEISETDKLVRERMSTMWTNFAKFGNPTPTVDDIITTKWEPVTDIMSYLFIDDKLTMKENPYPNRTKLYEELYKKYY